MKGATTDRRVTTSIIAGLALVALIVHLLTIDRYGYFRDELYYIACARHLDFGYVDLAPLSAFLLRIELILFGSSCSRCGFFLRWQARLRSCSREFSHGSWAAVRGRLLSPARACSGACFSSPSATFIRPMFMSLCFGRARFTCFAELLTAHHLAPGSGSVSSSAPEFKTSTPQFFSAWQSSSRFC